MQQNTYQIIFCKNTKCSLCTKPETLWKYSVSSDVTFMKIKRIKLLKIVPFFLFILSE